MTTRPTEPFSARNRPVNRLIEDDFPATARIGLLHLLNHAIDEHYLSSWIMVAKEVGRIARVELEQYESSSYDYIRMARTNVEAQLHKLEWQRVYDFCERLHSYLAIGGTFQKGFDEIVVTKAEAQAFIADELQRLFQEENLGYDFKHGIVERRGKQHTINLITKAEKTLSDHRLNSARWHYSKALRQFRDREHRDLENTVKEAVCAVEAAAKELFPDAMADTLGDFAKWACNDGRLLPKTIGQTFTGLYAFRNSGEGVSHGATSGGVVTNELTEYIMGLVASQIVLLAGLAPDEELPPF